MAATATIVPTHLISLSTDDLNLKFILDSFA
jgi:hypothetical protein